MREIEEFLNFSKRVINIHNYHIRCKLNLTTKR